MHSSTPEKSSPGKTRRVFRRLGTALRYVGGGVIAIYIFGLIFYCGPFPGAGNFILAALWNIAFLTGIFIRPRKWTSAILVSLFPILVVSYNFIKPSHDRDWVESQTKTSSATVTGDTLEIRNFRAFDYDADGLPMAKWETRKYDLNSLRGMDLFMTHWITELAGHPIFSFDFGKQGHLALTIEARLEKDEEYSLLAGFYRRFELSYIPCEEWDAIRARTNFRENENVHLYKTIATPEQARERLLEFVATMNDIARQPRFYNVVSSNCTTAVRSQMTGGFPFDWRIIINGKLDEMLYDRGLLVTGGLPFTDLKRRAFINPKVREHTEKKGFSTRVRQNVTGF